jgi:hypothetical protein
MLNDLVRDVAIMPPLNALIKWLTGELQGYVAAVRSRPGQRACSRPYERHLHLVL